MTRWKIILGAVLLVLGAHGVQGAAQAAAVRRAAQARRATPRVSGKKRHTPQPRPVMTRPTAARAVTAAEAAMAGVALCWRRGGCCTLAPM